METTTANVTVRHNGREYHGATIKDVQRAIKAAEKAYALAANEATALCERETLRWLVGLDRETIREWAFAVEPAQVEDQVPERIIREGRRYWRGFNDPVLVREDDNGDPFYTVLATFDANGETFVASGPFIKGRLARELDRVLG